MERPWADSSTRLDSSSSFPSSLFYFLSFDDHLQSNYYNPHPTLLLPFIGKKVGRFTSQLHSNSCSIDRWNENGTRAYTLSSSFSTSFFTVKLAFLFTSFGLSLSLRRTNTNKRSQTATTATAATEYTVQCTLYLRKEAPPTPRRRRRNSSAPLISIIDTLRVGWWRWWLSA